MKFWYKAYLKNYCKLFAFRIKNKSLLYKKSADILKLIIGCVLIKKGVWISNLVS